MAPNMNAAVKYMLPVAPILLPVAVHFLLVNFVLLFGWLEITYTFSHAFLILAGIWACHARSDILSPIVFLVVVVITILLDIIQLGLHFSDFEDTNGGGHTESQRTWQFSAAMCIMNLLFKPVTIALACIAIYIRAGGNIGPFGAGGNSEEYSDLHGSNQGTE